MSEGNEEKVEDPVENGEQKGIELPDIILNIPDLIGRPFNNPFEVEVFDKNNNTLNRLDLSLENIKETKIENYSPLSSYCNGNNHLYISGGINKDNAILNDFWDIDLNNKIIEKIPEGISPKKNHSMIFIPEKYVFIVGGNDKKTFYYDIEKKEIINWADLNHERVEPALIVVRDELYCFDNIKRRSNEITFEKTNLVKSPNWELIKPTLDPSINENEFNQKFFGASKIDNDNIIFLCGNMSDKNSDKNYIYNISTNTLSKSDIPFIEKNLAEKSFLNYNDHLNYLLPDYNIESPEIIFYNKEKQKLIPVNFEEKKLDKNLLRGSKLKAKKNKTFDFNMPERVTITNDELNKINLEIKNEEPVKDNKYKIELKKAPHNINDIENDKANFENEINDKLENIPEVDESKMQTQNIELPNKTDTTEYYFKPIDKKKKEKVNNSNIQPAMIIDNINEKKEDNGKDYLKNKDHNAEYLGNGNLLVSSMITNNKYGNIRTKNLPKVNKSKLSFKSSQIGSAGEFNSSNFKKLSESVNVGISGKKAGAKIFS